MKKIVLNPEQLRVESFHVDAGRQGAAGTVQGHGAGGAELFLPPTREPNLTCAASCETVICIC
jgi:hypothetical protein